MQAPRRAVAERQTDTAYRGFRLNEQHETRESLRDYMGLYGHLPGPRPERSESNWNNQIMLLASVLEASCQ